VDERGGHVDYFGRREVGVTEKAVLPEHLPVVARIHHERLLAESALGQAVERTPELLKRPVDPPVVVLAGRLGVRCDPVEIVDPGLVTELVGVHVVAVVRCMPAGSPDDVDERRRHVVDCPPRRIIEDRRDTVVHPSLGVDRDLVALKIEHRPDSVGNDVFETENVTAWRQ